MVFKDYYAILGVVKDATAEEVRRAYREASLRWHPDRNGGRDTTSQMQDINEAYAILKDETLRSRYDREYERFRQASAPTANHDMSDGGGERYDYDYTVEDEEVSQDIHRARTQAKDLVDEFMRHLREDSRRAVKGAWEGSVGYIVAAIILSVIGLIVYGAM